jgi:RNA polymerase sigma factor (sigma-70 family)
MGVARNVLRAYIRGANFVNEIESDSVDEQTEADCGDNPLAIAARRELTSILKRAVRGLSTQHRRVLELRYFEGRSGADTARVLGVSRQTVHEYERLGLQRLRAVLGAAIDMRP